jgi:hypothetical protein
MGMTAFVSAEFGSNPTGGSAALVMVVSGVIGEVMR